MCTVSYMPLPAGGFIMTSTRDERLLRSPALPPDNYEVHGRKVYFPRDLDAMGTWIASGPDVDTLCLLNGGFELHEHTPPYRKSRGLVLLDYYKENDLAWFRDEYNLDGIEPFTLLVHGGTLSSLDELRWDGDLIHHRSVPADLAGIWSSVTLYTPEVIQQRKVWFDTWIHTSPQLSTGLIVNFHKTAGTGDTYNDILMNRDNTIRSVSITSLTRIAGKHEFYYEDMVDPGSFQCPVK